MNDQNHAQKPAPICRFPNVYAALDGLRRSQNPALQSEAQKAVHMIWGERPGIEQKYDALLLKLDRSYSNLTDKRDHWKRVAEESPLARTRQFAKAKVSALNILLADLQWMKARNRDLMAAVTSTPDDQAQPPATWGPYTRWGDWYVLMPPNAEVSDGGPLAHKNESPKTLDDEVPGSDATPWPARDVVAKLVEATDILLDDHDYDGHGYELIAEARRVARAWLRQNTKIRRDADSAAPQPKEHSND